MSYILDALRKSEQERQRESPPVLRSIHAHFARSRRPRSAYARYFVVAALVVAGAGAGVWFGARQGASTPVQVLETAVTAQSEAPAVEALPVERPLAPPAPVTRPASGELLEIWQLSEAEQRFLHDLKVSLHVYSSEPLQRTVIINGFRVREGQPLGQDLSLVEITSDGIIVDFQGQRVHLATEASF
jgi:hypothetical protein